MSRVYSKHSIYLIKNILIIFLHITLTEDFIIIIKFMINVVLRIAIHPSIGAKLLITLNDIRLMRVKED